jgi:SAM-dependent methyltransferase
MQELESSSTKLLPIRLRELWATSRGNNLSSDEWARRQNLELDECAAIWTRALLLPREDDLVWSMLIEIGRWRGISDLELARRGCEGALHSNKLDWERRVHQEEAGQVEKYYENANYYVDELMWWHTLAEDNSPLAYVAVLEFALLAGCKSYLDFDSGVGSGALLFRNYGFHETLGDISSRMLSFCEYRFRERGRQARFLNLRQSGLPKATLDLVTAMDAFEYLVDPVGTVESLHRCLEPGGYVYGRFSAEEGEDRPQHIVRDFQPIVDRFADLGFKEVFRDDWCGVIWCCKNHLTSRLSCY